MCPSTDLGAIILAGGAGRRLGGVSKPDLEIGGERLVDIAVRAVGGARSIVVVAPSQVRVPAGVERTLEDPPGGGPVAGIAAGLAVLRAAAGGDEGRSGPADALVIACDMPGVGSVVPELLAAAAQRPCEADGVIARRPNGRRENLAFVASIGAMTAALSSGGDRDRSVRSLLAQLVLVEHTVESDALDDIDTWDQHRTWAQRWRPSAGPTVRPSSGSSP